MSVKKVMKEVIQRVEMWECNGVSYETREEALCADICTDPDFSENVKVVLNLTLGSKFNLCDAVKYLRENSELVRRILDHGQVQSLDEVIGCSDVSERIRGLLENAWKHGYDSYREIHKENNPVLWSPISMVSSEDTKFIDDQKLYPFINMAISDGFRVASRVNNERYNGKEIGLEGVLAVCYGCIDALYSNWDKLNNVPVGEKLY